jgi:hypothetical protein
VLLGCGVLFAVSALEQLTKPKPELQAMLPEGALLSIEARDFGSLLRDWNTSEEKRAWLTSDNHAAFSTSRLFGRLSQAQDEFSAVAGLRTDGSLLEKVAGKESCLGLYDIGNLEFVYVTHLEQREIENTPLWQIRGKFEQRSEAGTPFYVHKDSQSSRVAAFAVRDGWLILATREDLVAGVLDRLAGRASRNLASEGWFAEAVKQASEERGDLRMVLNLEKIVRTPYFRSYWVQRNITEMKQYASAVSDLYRTSQSYQEERVLVRRAGLPAQHSGDVGEISALAPEDAAFYAAQAAPSPESVLQTLREDLLEEQPQRLADSYTSAPPAVAMENAGSAAQLDVRIDQVPVAVKQLDPYTSLRALLLENPPEASLEVYSTRAPRDGVFVSTQAAMVLSAPQDWDRDAVCEAFTSALLPGLTTGRNGLQWKKQSSSEKVVGEAQEYLALDGTVPLFLSVKGKQLILTNDALLLEHLLARQPKVAPAGEKGYFTYVAFFHHTQERNNYRRLMTQLDLAGHRGGSDQQGTAASGQTPAFFSGDAASLSRVFSKVESERIEEKDQGTKVTQTVTYLWTH